MTDTFEFTLNNPLTEEQWDMISDVDMERTDSITFHTKHGKEVKFAKVRHGRWIIDGRRFSCGYVWMHCSVCGKEDIDSHVTKTNYCPNCGARMDSERKEE